MIQNRIGKQAGVNLPVNVAPNTRVHLPLLGDVGVNEQLLPSIAHGLMRINGLRIVVATANARI